MSAPDSVKPWFAEWFDHDYLLVYGHRDGRDARKGVELMVSTMSPAPGARILDLACGPGRHAIEMQHAGLHPIGLDLSPVLLNEAHSRSEGTIPLVRADMRAVPARTASFDLVASFFTSFGYFDDAGNAQVLAEMARLLVPGGGLFLDYVNRDVVLRDLEPEGRRRLGSTFVLEARRFDEQSGRLIKDIEIQDSNVSRHRTESVRLYHAEEMLAMLEAHALQPGKLFGDLQGAPWDRAASSRLVITARRT